MSIHSLKVLPYVLKILASLHETLRPLLGQPAATVGNAPLQILRRLIIRIYDTMCNVLRRNYIACESLWGLLALTQQTRYLLGGSKHWSPILALCSIGLVRKQHSLSGKTGGLSGVSMQRLVVGAAVLATVLAVRAADELLRTPDPTAGRPRVDQPIPFPSAPLARSGCLTLPLNRTLCPLCRRPKTNPCVASSGIIFCFECIGAVIDKNSDDPRCPVTDIPCQRKDLIRVFD
jgi:hypothetical protein